MEYIVFIVYIIAVVFTVAVIKNITETKALKQKYNGRKHDYVLCAPISLSYIGLVFMILYTILEILCFKNLPSIGKGSFLIEFLIIKIF